MEKQSVAQVLDLMPLAGCVKSASIREKRFNGGNLEIVGLNRSEVPA
ncbi:MAG: hypothetical protein NTU79_02250 [Planctomycetota bacterium]|nr:hypothetical protein [Planctomycetota bacterium]